MEPEKPSNETDQIEGLDTVKNMAGNIIGQEKVEAIENSVDSLLGIIPEEHRSKLKEIAGEALTKIVSLFKS